MDKKEESTEKRAQILNAEKEISLYLVQNYDGIEQIEFQEVKYFKETGSWWWTAIINNENKFSFTTHGLINVNENLTISYDKLTLEKKENSNANLDNVNIIYKGEGNDK